MSPLRSMHIPGPLYPPTRSLGRQWGRAPTPALVLASCHLHTSLPRKARSQATHLLRQRRDGPAPRHSEDPSDPSLSSFSKAEEEPEASAVSVVLDHLLLTAETAMRSQRSSRLPPPAPSKVARALGVSPLTSGITSDASHLALQLCALNPHTPPEQARSLLRSLLGIDPRGPHYDLLEQGWVRLTKMGFHHLASRLRGHMARTPGRPRDIDVHPTVRWMEQKNQLNRMFSGRLSTVAINKAYHNAIHSSVAQPLSVEERTGFITLHARAGNTSDAHRIFRDIRRDGLYATTSTWTSLMYAYARARDVGALWTLYGLFRRTRLHHSPATIAVVMNAFARAGDLSKVLLLRRIRQQHRLREAWPGMEMEMMIEAAARKGDVVRAIRYNAAMMDEGRVPGPEARKALLMCMKLAAPRPSVRKHTVGQKMWKGMFSSVSEMPQTVNVAHALRIIYANWEKHGLLQNRHLAASFCSRFVVLGDSMMANRAFNAIPNPTRQAFTSMLRLYAKHGNWREARAIAGKLMASGSPNTFPDVPFFAAMTHVAASVWNPSAIRWCLQTSATILGPGVSLERALATAIWGAGRKGNVAGAIGYWRAYLATRPKSFPPFMILWLWMAYARATPKDWVEAMSVGREWEQKRLTWWWKSLRKNLAQKASIALEDAIGDGLFGELQAWAIGPEGHRVLHVRKTVTYYRPRYFQREIRSHRLGADVDKACVYMDVPLSQEAIKRILHPLPAGTRYEDERVWSTMPLPTPLELWRVTKYLKIPLNTNTCNVMLTAMARWGSEMGLLEVSQWMKLMCHFPIHRDMHRRIKEERNLGLRIFNNN
ncbi:MAG: hypothetical protein DHS80DRAFT_25829 [Piptocephalis tieghemiana]|nr:MAG: hypothetical protein DHS80DRAFT_25829 [Piptocephalis tieghemiana]